MTLLARQVVRVDVQMQIAGAAESVEVTAVTPVIETERATIDSSRSGDDIAKLALNFRATNNTSPIVVATLAQGVQQDRTGDISVAGALPFMTSFSVDGISTQRVRFGGPSKELFPSVESIEEFKVAIGEQQRRVHAGDRPDDDHAQRHESVPRHRLLVQPEQRADARPSRFTPRDASGDPIKPEINANSFGLSGGGPIARNRAFFFGTYEGVRRPNEVTLSQIVPPDAWRSGDLSSVATPIRNPFTGQPFRRQPDSGESGVGDGCSSRSTRGRTSRPAPRSTRRTSSSMRPVTTRSNGFDGRVDFVASHDAEDVRPVDDRRTSTT